MQHIDHFYIDGAFIRPHGSDLFELISPVTEEVIGTTVLGDRDDVQRAVSAAQRALPSHGRTSKAERIAMLMRLQKAIEARADDIRDATIDEYGGPVSRSAWVAQYAAQCFLYAAQTLESYPLTRSIGAAQVLMEPVGVAALIAPWNSTAGTICSKLSMAIAAGCTAIVKPSEMSAIQAHVVAEAIADADLPPGVVNFVNGRGDAVGTELSVHPGIAKISFTGSTPTGKAILRASADTMKRVSLGLTGKSPTLILDDADLDDVVPLVLSAGFLNSGQACIAGTRILVPAHRLADVLARIKTAVTAIRTGDPRDPTTNIGPMASRQQYERVQRYIRSGIDEGATLIVGGEGRPDGLQRGYFVRPTIFSGVRNDMTIAREEIFGPVLCVMAYEDENEAINIANDSDYGLQGYVFSSDPERARAVASQLEVGSVMIKGLKQEPLAPFGGVKQSGLGREFGVFGLESYLEPKTVIEA
jgi:aldehyde dehydrogenase (NAD+)